MRGNNGDVAEITFRVIILAVLLTTLLAVSNAYMALKLGILTSASIPAAIISMAVLRLFKNPSILENNAVQTAASAGEAIAGGLVYTIPALIIIQYWQHFDYLSSFVIALSGGVLGVLFSIPLRHRLVNESSLAFPEGRAIAEVLKSSAGYTNSRFIFMGGLIGGIFELLQTGFKCVASSWNFWFVIKDSLFGVGLGFAATMLGAGFLVGYEMSLNIFIGAIISYLIAMPIVSQMHPELLLLDLSQSAALLWNNELRYLGIGAMLFAGSWTFLRFLKPLAKGIRFPKFGFSHERLQLVATDKDLPRPYILFGIIFMALVLFIFFHTTFPYAKLGVSVSNSDFLSVAAVVYVLVMGFLFSVITAYFSGMVGVTASPGSSIVIAGMFLAASLLLLFLNQILPLPFSKAQINAAEAITIIIGSVVTGIAAIANDNTQDLKVGQLVGATPWKQQLMLLLGVVVSSLIIPIIIQLLFEVYGIAGVMPREGMDISQSLPAPIAALMAAITDAVFYKKLPWDMLFSGSLVVIFLLIVSYFFKLARFVRLSILGVAIGMYLPLASSIPLFLGGLIAKIVSACLIRKKFSAWESRKRMESGVLIACGLVAGSALMDVILAIPFAIFHSPEVLAIKVAGLQNHSLILGILSVILLAIWIWHCVVNKENPAHELV